MKNKIINTIFYILVFFSFLLYFSIIWITKTFGLINLDSLLFHLNISLKGTSDSMVISYFKDPFFKSLIVLIILIIFGNIKYVYRIIINIRLFKFKLNNKTHNT